MPTPRSRSPSPAQLSHSKATALLARLALPPTLLPKPAPPSEERLARQERLWSDVRTCEQENELLLSELRRAVEELDTPLKPTPAQTPEQTRLALLEQEVAHLEAAIDFYSTDPPHASDPRFKPSPSCVQNDITASLARTITELEKALKRETTRAEKERREVARERTLCDDARALESALRKRLEEGSEELSAEEVIARAQRKAARVNESFGELMRSLVAFIDEWIAGDQEEEKEAMDIRRFFKPVGAEEGEEEDKALVLKQLLENLMNAALVESPLDPYLDISDIPRELIDFLVGAGVVLEHPGDGRKVRLVDFGRRMGE